MTMVWGDPAGFAVDWDWQRGLTVWTVTGPRFESRFDRKILEHELPARPAGERRARAVAARWWRTHGRSDASGRSDAPGRSREQGQETERAAEPHSA